MELTVHASTDVGEPAQERGHRIDESAFRLLYKQTSDDLFRYLLRVSGQRQVAEDLLQETYCRLLAAPLPAMHEAGQRRYLFRIATNLLRDRWRRVPEGSLTGAADPAGPAPDAAAKLGVRQAFQQLKTRERQLLWLAYVEGCSHKEIADTTGLRTGSIRLLLFRARRKLADLILQPRRSDTEVQA